MSNVAILRILVAFFAHFGSICRYLRSFSETVTWSDFH